MNLFAIKKKTQGVQVFVSYRREGGRDLARNIYERLSMSGYITFFDYDSMRNGKFNTQIFEAIDQATDFILVLSKGALNRCSNDDDWVRTEIEYALNKGKNIVLVASEDFREFPSDLPKSISSIKDIDIVFLYNKNKHYDQSIADMKRALKARPSWLLGKTAFILGIFISVLFLAVISYGIGKYLSQEKEPEGTIMTVKPYSATIHLMRYDKLKLAHGTGLKENYLKIFSYGDSISENSDMYIYPKSLYISYASGNFVSVSDYENLDNLMIPYHDPVIQLQLQSKSPNTLVLTEAVMEIEDWRYDDQPAFFFNMSRNTLQIVNEGANLINKGVLRYSHIYPEESFVNYKYTQELQLNNNITAVSLSPSYEEKHIRGELSLPNGNSFSFKTITKDSIPLLEQTLDPVTMPNLHIYDIGEKPSQKIKLDDFCRSLTKGEIDDEVHFALHCGYSCTFRVRLRMISSFGQELLSNYLYIRYSKPNHGYNIIKK